MKKEINAAALKRRLMELRKIFMQSQQPYDRGAKRAIDSAVAVICDLQKDTQSCASQCIADGIENALLSDFWDGLA